VLNSGEEHVDLLEAFEEACKKNGRKRSANCLEKELQTLKDNHKVSEIQDLTVKHREEIAEINTKVWVIKFPSMFTI
jgi:hypothetical protein